MKRVFNFNAGPSPLPLEVMEEVQAEWTDFRDTGMGIIEMSHRSAPYQVMHDETKDLLRRLMGIPEDRDILFIQGGGSMQFLMEAANFHTKQCAAYANTGVWAEKAMKVAAFYGETYEACSSADQNHSYIPEHFDIRPGTSYLHITSNNTIYGTEYQHFPQVSVPLICDMSSDILSRQVDVTPFSMIYAGVQKNLGAAGMALAVVKKDFLETARKDLPVMLQYRTFSDHDSLYNTPPVFCIYMVNKMLHWIENMGGMDVIEKRNKEKADILYGVIDSSGGFYKGHAEKASRSRMNVTFRLPTEEMEKDFISQAKAHGFIGVGGHRLVGGCRVSLYNAVTPDACRTLADFMKDYQKNA